MKNRIVKQKVLSLILLLLTVAQAMHPSIAAALSIYDIQAFNSAVGEQPKPSEPITHYGVVAVLVDDELMNNPTEYDGLRTKPVGANQETILQLFPKALTALTLAARVRRYALDAQRVRPFTKSIIIKVKRDEKVENIVNALERLYMEGDKVNISLGQLGGIQLPLNNTADKNSVSQLRGVVVVGDVPLPVVNKNGNRFVSMLPYTDFLDKAYVYDANSKDFIPNKNSTSTQPEVWEGVIKPPLPGEDGNKLLAEYFDKNYLYHCNTTSCDQPAQFYKQFSRKMLYTDFVNEFKQMNKPGFANYLRYLANWEDITYERWSKLLAQKFVQGALDQTTDTSGGDPAPQPNDYDPDMDGVQNKDPAGETKGVFDKKGKELPDGCPGVCKVDEDKDSVDSDSDGFPDGYEKEIGSDVTCLVNPFVVSPVTLAKLIAQYGASEGEKRALLTDPTNPDDYPRTCFFVGIIPMSISRVSPGVHPEWWIDEGKTYEDRPYNFTKNGTNCSTPNTDTANCAGNPADDDEDGTIDEEADADKHPNDHQNHFNPQADGNTFSLFPDIMTRELIMQTAGTYNSLFDKFKANINDWVGFTGRWNPSYTDALGNNKSDVSTIPGLVTMKDEMTRKYLRLVNDAVENRIDFMVKRKIDPSNPFALSYAKLNPPPAFYNALLPFIDPAKKYLEKEIPLLMGAKIQMKIDFIDDSDYSATPVEFVNFANYPDTYTVPGPIPQTVTVNNMFVNGLGASKLTNVQQCNLYRGSKGPDGSNSSLVIASHLYNTFAVDDQSIEGEYAGCIGRNAMHPEFCYLDRASRGVFDIIGTRPADAVTQKQTDYTTCFDMRYKPGFDEYQTSVDTYIATINDADHKGNAAMQVQVPLPRSPYTPADQIDLMNDDNVPFVGIPLPGNITINFNNILKIFGAIDKKDNNKDGVVDEIAEASPLYALAPDDYKRIGSELLQKSDSYLIKNSDLLDSILPGLDFIHRATIKDVVMMVEAVPAIVNNQQVNIGSYVAHKEPTAQTLAKQRSPGVAPLSLPIDNPRYFTFLDSKDVQQIINYPNFFAAKSYDELKQLVAGTEAKLNAVAKANNVNLDFTGQLTSLLKGDEDLFADPVGKEQLILANKNKLKDAYDWMKLNIDQKHDYITSVYLDPKKDPYIGQSGNGYDAMYLVADGDAQNFNMNFNGDIPEKDSDPKLDEIAKQPDTPATTPKPVQGQPGQSGGGDSGTPDVEQYAVNLLQWFGAILKWVADMATLAGGDFKSAPVCGAADQMDEAAAAAETQPVNFNNNDFLNVKGEMDAAKDTVKLRISSDKKMVKAGASEYATITVEGIKNNNELNAKDNVTKVNLKVTKVEGDNVFTVSPATPLNLNGGKTTFRLMATDVEGKVKVSAFATEKPTIQSHEDVTVESTLRSIRIVSYSMAAKPSFQNQQASGFIILDANKKIIAEVDGKTGMVTITDNNFELVALPSSKQKPARLGVREKSSQIIVASVFFVTDQSAAAVVDKNVDYYTSYATLGGTHVKDRNENDQYFAQSVGMDQKFNTGGVYLMKNGQAQGGGLIQTKVGIVDTLGNIFLKPEFKLQIKDPHESTSPVVFVVTDQNGNGLFEVYMAAKFTKIEILKEEGNYQDFNLAFLVTRALAALPESLRLPILGVAHAAEAFIPDTDKDGLNDLEELIIGTKYNNPNTSGDGLTDSADLLANLNPLKKGEALFKDLNPNSKGFKDIIKLFTRGVLTGYSDGTFRPDRQLSREEFVKLDLGSVCISCTKFDEAIKQKLDSFYAKAPFPDKNIDPNLQYCVKQGKYDNIISGYKGGTMTGFFLPNNAISRAEATKVILETVNRQAGDAIPVSESAAQSGGGQQAGAKPWYYNYVLAAQKEKLFPQGYFPELDSDTPVKFQAWFDNELYNAANGKNSAFINWITGEITRTEFAIMVSRLIDKYDCFKQDQDNDGIPDNFEKYVFGTDPTKADTDGGGVNDLQEIINGTNPLDPKDDHAAPKGPVDDNDGLPADWEKKYGLNPYDPSDANKDIDGDGLTNLQEFELGTDPTNPDTDGGGVSDGDEVLRGTDPLNPADDKPIAGTEGGFIVGHNDNVFDNYKTVLVDSGSQPGDGTTDFEYTDEMPADNKSFLYIKASITDQNGNVITSDSQSELQFSDALNGEKFATIDPVKMQVTEGVADKVKLNAGKAKGIYAVTAKITGKDIPGDIKNIYIQPQEPASIYLHADSPVIRSGGVSTTKLRAELHDKNGNLCDNQSYVVTFNVSGEGEFVNAADEDPNKEGVQISSVFGVNELVLASKAKPGDIYVTANYEPPAEDQVGAQNTADTQQVAATQQTLINSLSNLAVNTAKQIFLKGIPASTKVQSRDDLKIVLKPDVAALPSDYASSTKVKLEVQGKNNSVVTDFQGIANFSIANEKYGRLVDPKEQQVKNGRALMTFGTSNAAGDAVITATVQGFDSTSTTIKSLPKEPKKILMDSETDTIESNPDASMEISAKLYDTDGNFADNNSTTTVNFRLTDDSKKFAYIDGPDSVKAKDGVAKFTLKARELTGPISIIAESNGLIPASLTLKSIKKFASTNFKDIGSHVLYASLLGSDFGNIFKENYMAGWFVFSGDAEAATTLISPPKPKAHLVEITPTGKLTLVDNSNYDAKVIPNNGTGKPNRILIFDVVDKKDLAEMAVVNSADSRVFQVDDQNPVNPDREGVYVERIEPSTDYEMKLFNGGISLVKTGNEAVKIMDNGDVRIMNPTFQLNFAPADDSKFLTFSITDSGRVIANLTFVTNFSSDLNLLPKETEIDGTSAGLPGAYLRIISIKKNIGYDLAFSGNSTNEPKGVFITDKDTDLPSNQAPGQTYQSLEKAGEAEGIGFTGENKHMLLFSGGNTVGESNLPYASEIGVVIGDPTIKRDNRTTLTPSDYQKSLVFTKDIGQEIYMGSDPIQEIVPIDYNSDGLKDLFVAYRNGQIRLLQNNNAYPRYEDRGIFLNFPNGILSLTAGDLDHDGQEDLVVASADSCRAGEICIDAFMNHGGNFVRQHLNLKNFSDKNRVYMIRLADMNNDGYPDLVTSDDTGTIRVFWNIKGKIQSNGQFVGSLGIHVDPTTNLKTEVLVYYQGVPGAPYNSADTADDANFKKITVPQKQEEGATADAAADNAVNNYANMANSLGDPTPSANAPSAQTGYDFIYLDLDSNLGIQSQKIARDLTEPFNVVAKGDQIEYTITLKNTGTKEIKDLMVSDVIASQVTLDKASIQCADCDQPVQPLETGESLRPLVFAGINIPAGKFRTIKYDVTVNNTPTVKIIPGNNFDSGYQTDDYWDIAATPDGNPTGRMVYFYSSKLIVHKNIDPNPNKYIEIGTDQFDPNLYDPLKRFVKYEQYVTPPPAPPDPATDPNARDFGAMKTKMTEDKNGNGLPDYVEGLQTTMGQQSAQQDSNSGDTLDKLGDDIEATINKFTCLGGCIPMPINFAFLAPGMINAMGLPAGLDMGLPVFAAGIPSIIPVWPPSPYQASVFRLYLSPTLTGRLGLGLCLGPYLGGMCFAFALPLPGLSGETCDKITGGINNILSGAKNVAKSVTGELATSSDASSTGADASGRQETGGFSSTASLGNYHPSVKVGTNFRIPGFPSVITEWLDRQSEEIITKLTNLPDLFVFLPNPISIAGAIFPQDGQPDPNPSVKSTMEKVKKSFNKMTLSPKSWLSVLNSVPLIQIESRDVLFKIPALTNKEIVKLQRDAQQWMIDERHELNLTLRLWSCGYTWQYDETLPYNEWKKVPATEKTKYDSSAATACEKLLVDMTSLTSAVEKNIQVLEKWKQLPKQILAFRTILFKYIQQLVCYLDAIVKYVGGYITEQQKRIEAYMEAFRKILQQIKDFKLIFDLMIDYNASCDKCSTARFSLFELLLKLFVVIPSPPVIAFPKWPDIYFDMSNIQAGLKIVWPDIRFRPEPIIMPKIPRIYLPDLPTLTIVLPTLPVLPDPPKIPLDLPDLPPLPLPSLPNLPPPPKLPNIFPVSIKAAISILKKILRILCLLRKGLIPVAETSLKAQIEQMTERSLSMLLPFDLGLNVQYPPVALDLGIPSKIEIAGHLNLQLNFENIYNFVQNLADKANGYTTDFVKWVNDQIKKAEKAGAAAGDVVNQQTNQQVGGNKTVNVTYAPVKTPEEAAKMIKQIQPDLGKLADQMIQLNKEIARTAKEYDEYNKQIQDFHLVATQKLLSTDDPILNRPIAQIKSSLKDEIPPQLEFQKKATNLRSALIAYNDAQQQIDKALNETTDNAEFGRLIALSPSLNSYLEKMDKVTPDTKLYASIDPVQKTDKPQNTNDPIINTLKDAGENALKAIKTRTRLLADYSQPDVPGTPGMETTTAKPIGIFIYDPATGTSDRLINYTGEADKPSQLVLADVTNDGNTDIIYSYGGNIYLKENLKAVQPANVKTYIKKYAPIYTNDKPAEKDLLDFVPRGPAVNSLAASYNNNKLVELSWDKGAQDNLAGYELDYMTAPDAFSQDLNVRTHKVGLALKGENTEEKLPEDAPFKPDKVEIPYLVAESLGGDVFVDGPERTIINAGDAPVKVTGAYQIHTLTESEISFSLNGTDQGTLKLQTNRLFTIPGGFKDGVDMQVTSGSIEVINTQKEAKGQKMLSGMLVDYDQVLTTKNNSQVLVRFGNGSYITARNGEDLLMKKLDDAENPTTQLTLPNGFYYAKIYSFDQSGFRSTVSGMALMAPSICADKQAPVVNAGPSERSVSIFKQLVIDASKSFDANGKIIAYWIDTDLNYDSDKNGDPTDDKNMAHDLNPFIDTNGDGITFNDMNDPVFRLGPYQDLSQRKIKINMADESNNVTGQEVTINVYVPKISLADTTATEGIIRGSIDPIDSDMPVSVMRERDGVIKKLITTAAKTDGKYYTDTNGEFTVGDLNLKDSIVIKNAKGEVIGEIDPETGRIFLFNQNYYTVVLPAEKPLLPTRVLVKDKKTDQTLITIFLVPDVNTDTTLDDPNLPYNKATVAVFKGVHSKDDDPLDDFEFSKLGMDDPVFPGATIITEKTTQKRAAILDTGGNFYVIDKRLSLRLKEEKDLKDPMIIEIVFTPEGSTAGTVLGEFYIAVHSTKGVQFLPPDKLKALSGKSSGSDPLFDSDHDGMPDFWEITYGLNPKDPADAALDNDSDGLTNLQEYKLGSNPLNPDSNGNGINDSTELKYGRNPAEKVVSPFTDVTVENPYYQSIMNLFERNILKGIPKGRGLLFGPEEAFTRAEFAKMMLDIFCIIPRKEAYDGPSPFTDLGYNVGKLAWYYANVKEAYFQGFVTGYLGEIDTKTGKSPFKPDNTISKAEVVKVILEALQRNGIIDMGKVAASVPWYSSYMQIAQDLKPYLKNKSRLRNVYILTAEEAKNPEAPITRGLFIAMADRVLTAYDCSAIDDDHDGMPSYWERLNGLNPHDPKDADLDPDKDGLTNKEEYEHGTDPHNPDTDAGGVNDGTEVKEGTNPLDPKDDLVDDDHDGMPTKWEKEHGLNPYNPIDANQDPDGDGLINLDEYKHNTDPHNPDTDGDGLLDGEEVHKYQTDPTNPDTDGGGVNDGDEVKRGTNPLDPTDDLFDIKSELSEGIYAVLEECNSCPCPASIEHSADIIPGDTIFGLISSMDDKQIFAESNKVKIISVPKQQ